MPRFHLAKFSCDVTPPKGHPLCGGWIEPVRGVDDPLQALGVVLLGMGRPVVLCAVDWCGLRNEAHQAWRKALAEATHTVPENVAVQCVHPHNAPFADVEAQHIIEAAKDVTSSLDRKFFDQVVAKIAEKAKESMTKTIPFSHLGVGQAKVDKVASNRRILGEDGKVQFIRYSATKDANIREAPEGLIDPWLQTVSFWQGDEPKVAMHYYATHPMSYYGDGRVTSDFCGLARQKRQDEDTTVFQIYFTGCAGNITAGKYNDGAKENRPVLRDRVYGAMKEAWQATKRSPIEEWDWRVESVSLPARSELSFGEEASRQVLNDGKQSAAKRINAAFQLAWLKRRNRPIDVTCLDLGQAMLLHLPGEPFIEYQLAAKKARSDIAVCVAGYGDGGPGYLPPAQAYSEGGYEPTVALAGSKSEMILQDAIAKLIQSQAKSPKK
jgi:hypothetical protein